MAGTALQEALRPRAHCRRERHQLLDGHVFIQKRNYVCERMVVYNSPPLLRNYDFGYFDRLSDFVPSFLNSPWQGRLEK